MRTRSILGQPTTADRNCCRPEFFNAHWRPEDATPHRIFSVTGDYPLKGTHVLLDAAAMLKRDYPDVQVRIPGVWLDVRRSWLQRLRSGGYRAYLIHRICKLGLEENVAGLGLLGARQMAEELAKAHVFVAPSFVENLCNALAEAMLVGTPSIASYVGGMVTTVHDRVEGLFSPRARP